MQIATPLIAGIGLVACLLGATISTAQERVQITSSSSCSGCTIRLTRVVRLGGPSDPSSLARTPTVARDSRGRFIVGPTLDGAQLHVYDASGKFLTSVGRRGRGPGEFQRISLVTVSAGDTLHVFDAVNLRHTVLSSDFRTVRTSPLPGRVYAAFPLGRGTTLVQAPARSSDRFGLPLHLINPDGRVVRSYGSLQKTYEPGDVDAEFRPVAQASTAMTWVGHVGRYELGLWDTNGRLVRTLVRGASWFRPREKGSRNDPNARPGHWIADLHEDAGRMLWVVVGTADRSWQPPRDRTDGERPLPTVREAGSLFDTILEVIDPKTGQLLASARDPGPPFAFFADNLASRAREDADGNVFVDVVRVELINPIVRRQQ